MIKKLIVPFMFIVVALSGCKDKSESMTNEEKIAGKEQKVWSATRETNAEGDKDKLTREEKKESLTFWRNGNVKMSNGNEMMSGQWAYNGNTLSIAFAGSPVSENFQVLELEDDRMKLQAGDGSTMTMKPE
jgi:uncharacterized lipoprotein NlpE involved in copper resistance